MRTPPSTPPPARKIASPGSRSCREERRELATIQLLQERPCLDAMHVLAHLIFTAILCWDYYHPHFTDKETAARRS